jgi:hypothetical protein
LTAIATATLSPRFTPVSADGGACKSSVPASAAFPLRVIDLGDLPRHAPLPPDGLPDAPAPELLPDEPALAATTATSVAGIGEAQRQRANRQHRVFIEILLRDRALRSRATAP